jgi:3-hydroxyisobutyrate dehydrogenase
MLAGQFAPQFPVELIEKDFGYVLREVSDPSAAPTIAAVRRMFQRAIEHGMGGDNMTAVVRLFET